MPIPRVPVNWRELWALVGIMAGVILLWSTPVVYPLKILVVFYHELSHAGAALLTGGSVRQIRIVPDEGGATETLGGSQFVILSAGYLGSMALGGVVLVLAARTKYDRQIAAIMGVSIILSTALYVRPVQSFGFGFGALVGAGLIASARWLPASFNDFLLKLIGLTSCLYAVFDIKDDILDRPGIPSDAFLLAERTGLPTLLWGVIWLSIAVAGAVVFLILSCRPRATGRIRLNSP